LDIVTAAVVASGLPSVKPQPEGDAEWNEREDKHCAVGLCRGKRRLQISLHQRRSISLARCNFVGQKQADKNDSLISSATTS
jgi:hypothetical protein